jgi:hypothetical protein
MSTVGPIGLFREDNPFQTSRSSKKIPRGRVGVRFFPGGFLILKTAVTRIGLFPERLKARFIESFCPFSWFGPSAFSERRMPIVPRFVVFQEKEET